MKNATIGQIVNSMNHTGGDKIGKIVEIRDHEIIVENRAGVQTCELLVMSRPATPAEITFFHRKSSDQFHRFDRFD